MTEIWKVNGYTYFVGDKLKELLDKEFLLYQEKAGQKNTKPRFSNPAWFVPKKTDTQKRQTEGED